MNDQFKRESSVEKQIKDLSRDDVRVTISGLIVSQNENSILLDDGTGQITITFEEPVKAEGYIRVFGRVMPYENSLEIQGEIVQNLDKIDKVLYKKVKELISK